MSLPGPGPPGHGLWTHGSRHQRHLAPLAPCSTGKPPSAVSGGVSSEYAGCTVGELFTLESEGVLGFEAEVFYQYTVTGKAALNGFVYAVAPYAAKLITVFATNMI